MPHELEKSQIKKAEERLIKKSCKKIGDLWDVPLNLLKMDRKFDFRRKRNPEILKSMSRDIEEKGLLNPPIAVYSIRDDQLILAVGFGRVRSVKRNKKGSILCRILFRKEVIPEEIYDLIVRDNVHREQMKPIELALLYRSWMKEKGLTQKDLAEKIHKSETYLSELLYPLKKLSEEEIELILTSELTRSQIMEIAKIDDRNLRLRLIKNKAPVRKIREILKKSKKKERKAESSNPRVFEFANDSARTALGDAKVRLKIEFPSDNWNEANVLEVLYRIISVIEETSRSFNAYFEPLDFLRRFKNGNRKN